MQWRRLGNSALKHTPPVKSEKLVEKETVIWGDRK
jgi:hypothetical protein